MGRSEQPFDAEAACRALHARCRALRSAGEDDRLIAREEAFRRRQEAVARRRAAIEQARDHDAWLLALRERALREEEGNHVAELVEVKVAPGPRWTPAWFEDHIRLRVPELEPRALDADLGVTAILHAVDRMETARRRGKRVDSAAGYVVGEARAVMAGKRTTWVPLDVALEQPALIVGERAQSYVGRVCARVNAHEKRLLADRDLRRSRGLLPPRPGC